MPHSYLKVHNVVHMIENMTTVRRQDFYTRNPSYRQVIW